MKVKVVTAPGITLTVALVFILHNPGPIWSGLWWVFLAGYSLMGMALNISLTRVQAWILRGPNPTVNQVFYTKEARK